MELRYVRVARNAQYLIANSSGEHNGLITIRVVL
jgi:hypothetical protein